MSEETRNSMTLAEFVAYCEKHPDQRFWQALTNWSGASHVYLLPSGAWSVYMGEVIDNAGMVNPYQWEGRTFNDKATRRTPRPSYR